MLLRYFIVAALVAALATESSPTKVENGDTNTSIVKNIDFKISEKDSSAFNESSSKDTGISEATGRFVFFDVNNIVNNMLRAVRFYTLGNANIVAPFNNVALETPVIGFVLLWLILLAVFVEYNNGTFDDWKEARSADTHRYGARILQDVLESLTRALQKHDPESKS